MFNNANTRIRKRKCNTIPIPSTATTEVGSNARSTLAAMSAHLPIPSMTEKISHQLVIYAWRSRAEKKVAHEVWHRTWQYLALPQPVHTRILCPGLLTAQMHPFHQHLILFKPSSNFLRPSSSSLSGSKPASTAYSLQNAVRACTVLTSSREEIFRRTGNQMSRMHCRVDSTEVGFVTRVSVRER